MDKESIIIKDLEFQYKGESTPCISHLNLEIKRGERFGIFGPNGAGKTTLINCIIGLLDYKVGKINIFGNDVIKEKKQTRKIIGFVPQDFSFYQELTPVENLFFFGTPYWYVYHSQTI